MDDNALFQHVREVLQEVLEDIDASRLTLETDLRALNVDSMLTVDLAYGLSMRLQRDIPFERYFVQQGDDGDYSIRAMIEFVKSHL